MDRESALDSAAETATTAAAETTTTAAMMEATTEAATAGGVYADLEPLGSISELDRAELLSRLVAEGDDLRVLSEEARAMFPGVDACLEETMLPSAINPDLPANGEPIVIGSVADGSGEQLLLVAYVTEEIEHTVFVTLRPADCRVVTILDE
jgi:hypothetical protein